MLFEHRLQPVNAGRRQVNHRHAVQHQADANVALRGCKATKFHNSRRHQLHVGLFCDQVKGIIDDEARMTSAERMIIQLPNSAEEILQLHLNRIIQVNRLQSCVEIDGAGALFLE